jgi:pantoate--beta-alanine ligase
MKTFHDIETYRQWRRQLPAGETVGFVPTMGALHEGHAKLLEVSKSQNQHTVLSIFVNPTQFGPNEDLSKYPRTLDADLKIAAARGVSAVFVPNEAMLYPEGYSTFVSEDKLTQPLEGVYRPGHFRGVTTIVLKLFNLIEAHHAYFGLKDVQQFLVVQKMVKDLNLAIQLTGVPTVRENTGLALSSRNVYLTEAERTKIAPKFYEILTETKKQLLAQLPIATVLNDAKEKLQATGFEVQYFELRALTDLSHLPANHPLAVGTEVVLAGALFLGKVRLIDNLIF